MGHTSGVIKTPPSKKGKEAVTGQPAARKAADLTHFLQAQRTRLKELGQQHQKEKQREEQEKQRAQQKEAERRAKVAQSRSRSVPPTSTPGRKSTTEQPKYVSEERLEYLFENYSLRLEALTYKMNSLQGEISALLKTKAEDTVQEEIDQTAMHLLDAGFKSLQEEVKALRTQQEALRSHLKVVDSWKETTDARSAGFLEHALKIEDQLQQLTVDMEKKFLQVQGQLDLCNAHINHAAEMRQAAATAPTTAPRSAADDLMALSLMGKIAAGEEKSHKGREALASTIAVLSDKMAARIESVSRGMATLESASQRIGNEMADVRADNEALIKRIRELEQRQVQQAIHFQSCQEAFEKEIRALLKRHASSPPAPPPVPEPPQQPTVPEPPQTTPIPQPTPTLPLFTPNMVMPLGTTVPPPAGTVPEPEPQKLLRPEDIATVIRTEIDKAMKPLQQTMVAVSSAPQSISVENRMAALVAKPSASPISLSTVPTYTGTLTPFTPSSTAQSPPAYTQAPPLQMSVMMQQSTPQIPSGFSQCMAPPSIMAVEVTSDLPQREVRMADTTPIGFQQTVLNPSLFGVPIATPKSFSGNYRDWPEFKREYERFDADTQALARTTEAARIRNFHALLDPSGKAIVDIMRHEAETSGKGLTHAEVMRRLDTELGAGGMNPRAQLRALVPELTGGRATGPQWRAFAGRFRLLAIRSPELTFEEKREHLLTRCLTAEQAKVIHEKDRTRAERPWALIGAFKAFQASEVRTWLQANNIDFVRVEKNDQGHRVQCASLPDLERLAQFHQSPVWDTQNANRQDTILVYRLETKMSPDEILDYIGLKLGVDEQVHDGRRTAQALYGTTPHQGVQFQTPPRGNRNSRNVRKVETTDTDGDTTDSTGECYVYAVGDTKTVKGGNKGAKESRDRKGQGKSGGKDSGKGDTDHSRPPTPPPPRQIDQKGKGKSSTGDRAYRHSPEQYPRDGNQDRRNDGPRGSDQDRRRDPPRDDRQWQGNRTGQNGGNGDDRNPGRNSPGRYLSSTNAPRGPVICYNCDKQGHMSRQCPEPRRQRQDRDNRDNRGMGGRGRSQSPGANARQ